MNHLSAITDDRKSNEGITRAKKQFGFAFWYQLLISKLHFVLRDKKVVLIPKLFLGRVNGTTSDYNFDN